MSYQANATKPLSIWLREFWGRGRLSHGLARAATGLGALSPLMALANPTGGQVVGGVATITSPNANSTQIKQSSQNAVINWQLFSVGANQYVQFLQPDSSAVILNRVIGNNPSSIFGDITANGQVFLINPNGILFGRGAVLDMSGLVASTQDISTSDFMAGNYRLIKGSGAPDASVINQGAITAAKNGYVVLAGDYVENDGVINAQSGRVLLAAGGATTLTLDKANGLISYSIDGATLARLAGVSNTGEITANGGTVIMTADVANALTATAVNNTGFIAAHSIQNHAGEIVLAATGGDIDNSGTLDASATDAGVGGGSVLLRTDKKTELETTSVITAEGDGATGGFIDLSGRGLAVRGLVRAGKGGDLLFDPREITLVSSCAVSCSFGSNWHVPISATNPNGVEYHLNHGSNVTLAASQSIGHSANVHAISANVAASHGGGGNLTMHAGPTAIGQIALSGVNINIAGGFSASAHQGTVTLGNVTAQSIFIEGNHITTGNLTALGVSSSRGANAVNLFASPNGAAAISMNVGNITANAGGRVLVHTAGNGVGKITVGNISDPSGSVSIAVSGRSTSAHGLISAGSITAKEVLIGTTAPAGDLITLGPITATSAFSASQPVVGGLAVYVTTPNNTVTMKPGANITASHGGVVINAANINLNSVSAGGKLEVNGIGSIDGVGRITVASGKTLKARNVTLFASGGYGGSIQVGNVTATGGSIVFGVKGTQGSNAGNINAGDLTATGGDIDVTQSDYIGRVTLGNLTANSGGIRITTNDLRSGGSVSFGSATAKTILVETTAPQGADIRITGALKATGAFASGSNSGMGIVLHANASGGASKSGGNIKLTASGSQAVHATAGGVSLRARGGLDSGGIIQVHGDILATGEVEVLGSNIGSCCGSVALKNVTGSDVQLRAFGIGNRLSVGNVDAIGSSIQISGARVTTGMLSATDRVRVHASNGSMHVSGISAGESVSLIQRGNGGISVGAIDAGGALGINARNSGGSAIVNVTGAITAEDVTILVSGHNPRFSDSKDITATGASSGPYLARGLCSGECGASGGIHHGFVGIKVFPTASSGSIHVTGTIKSLHGGVAVVSSYGGMTLGDISTARNVLLYGNQISVGAVTAGSQISITGVSNSISPIKIVANGLLKGAQVTVKADAPGHSSCTDSCVLVPPRFGASIDLKMGASANGLGTAEGGGLKGIDIEATGNGVTLNITSGPLYAAAGNIVVRQGGTSAAGSVKVTGLISASNGSVHIYQRGTGGISIGSVYAGKFASITAENPSGNNKGVVINGAVSASGVHIQGSASSGKGGSVTVNGNVTARSGNVDIDAFASSTGGNLKVTGTISAPHGAVNLFAGGAGNGGGNITVGNIAAGKGVSIGGSYFGTAEAGASHVTVKTGTITGEFVNVRVTGIAPIFSAAGITATGTTSAGAFHDYIHVNASATGSAGTSGLVKVTGPVISNHGSVSFGRATGASRGSINAQAITAKTGITLKGSTISVGALTATSGNVSIMGMSVSNKSTDITVTGAITAQSVKITESFASHALNGGSINLQGLVTATGTGGGSGQGINIEARTTAPVNMQINIAGLKADQGDIYVMQQGASGGIHATGLISATAGEVEITTVGGGSISVAGVHALEELSIVASGSHAGSITVNGSISGGGEGVYIATQGNGGGNITLNGKVKAVTGNVTINDAGLSAGIHATGLISATAGSVNISAVGSGGISVAGIHALDDVSIVAHGSHAGAITVNGSISAGGEGVFLTAAGSGGNNIDVTGKITVSNSDAVLSASAGNHSGGNITVGGKITTTTGSVRITTHGGGEVGGQINVGSIAAHGSVDISAAYTGTSPGFTVKTGKITAEYVNVGLTGFAPHFSAAGITANGSAEAGANIGVSLSATGAGQSSGSIKITGPVKSVHGTVTLNAEQGTITGATGATGKITAGSSISITGGQIQLGSLSAASNVKVSASNGARPDHIVITGNVVSQTSNVDIFARGSGASGGNITVGNVTAAQGLSISAQRVGNSAGFEVKTGNLTGGYVNVEMSGKGAHFSGGAITGKGASCECSHNVTVLLQTDTATTSSASINIKGAVKATAGGVYLYADRGIINMGGNSISAAGASGNVHLVGGQMHLGDIAAGGSLSLAAFAINSHAASITAAGTGLMTAKHVTIFLGDSHGSKGGNIAIGGVHANGATSGSIDISDSGLGSQKVTVTTGNLTAAKALSVQISDASGSMTLGKLKAATTIKVALAAGNLKVGAISAAAGSESISAATGSLTVATAGTVSLTGGTLKAGKAIRMTVGGDLTLTNVNLTDSAFSASAGSNLKISTTGSLNFAGQKAVAGKTLTLVATGDVKLGDANITGSVVDITAVNITNSSANGTITAGGGTLKATGNIDLDGETLHISGAGPNLSAADSVSLKAATVTGTGVLNVHAGNTASASNLHFTAGSLQIAAGLVADLKGATITATKAVDVVSRAIQMSGAHITGSAVGITDTGAGSIDLTNAVLKATHALDLHAIHGISLANAVLSGSAVSASAGGNITNGGALTAVAAGTGGLSLKAKGNLVLGGETLHVGGATLLSAGGSLDLTGATLTAAGDMTIHGATLTEDLTSLTASGTLTETGGSVDLTSATLKATRALDIRATHGINLANAMLQGSAVSASAGGNLTNGGSAASITGGAGGITLKAKGNVSLGGETLHVGSGPGTLSAGGLLDLTGVTLTGGGKTSLTAGKSIVMTGANLTLGSLAQTAGGSIDLSGVNATITHELQLKAKGDIVLSGVHLTANVFIASASGTIHNGSGPGSIKADAMAVVSKKDINLSSTDITLGSGAVPGFTGDVLLLEELAGFGIAPTSSVLNGVFLADGKLSLGGLSMTGDYLMLQGTDIAILGPVNVPTSGLLVQVMPFDPTAPIGVEGKPAVTQTFNMSNTGFFALFPGDTIAIGDDTESGAVFIGFNGAFTLAPKTNLFFDTTGPVTGLNLITSTGIVTTLETFVATVGADVVTVGEIDPTAGTTKTGLGDQTDKKHLGQFGGANGGGNGGLISNDDNPSGVCH